MPTNFLLPFASADGNNSLGDAAYSGSNVRLFGWQDGIVDGPTFSKMGRQGAIGSALAGQVIVDHANADAVDDGDIADLKALWRQAVTEMLAPTRFGIDTSAVPNAIVVNLDPSPIDLSNFRDIFVRIANTNTGAVSIALNALGTKNATRRDGTPLQAGDLISGQLAHFVLDKQLGFWVLAGLAAGEVPRITTADPVLYVRPDGNDSTADGSANSAAKAFQTIAAAAAYGRNRFYLANRSLILQLGTTSGIYAPPGNLDAGGGNIVVRGDPNNQAGYNIQGIGPSSGASALVASTNGTVTTNGVTITNTGNINANLAAAGAGSVVAFNTSFQTTVGTVPALVATYSGGNATINTGCIMGGSAQYMWLVSSGFLTMFDNVVLANTPTYSVATCSATTGGVFLLQGGKTFSGSGANGPRYLATNNGVIVTNGSGPNFFPGSTAGTADNTTGGRYV